MTDKHPYIFTVDEIISLAGGEDLIAHKIAKKPTKSTYESIRHWRTRGVPQKYVILIAAMADLDVANVIDAMCI